MKRLPWLWVVLCGLLLGSLTYEIRFGYIHKWWAQNLPQSYSKLQGLPVDKLVRKLEIGTDQEKIDAAAILGLERSHKLEEKHVVVLVKILESDYGALGFQCAYALLKMGKKAQSAIPALEKLAQTYRGKFAGNMVGEALGAAVSGVSAEYAEEISGKIFQVTGFQEDAYEDNELVARSLRFSRGFLKKSIFSCNFNRKHPAWLQISKLKEYDWVCLDVTDDAQVNIIVLSR